MIKILCVENLQDLVECRSFLYQSRESFLKCSFKLLAGNTYGVVSDFGYGSWGLVTCLAGRGTKEQSGNIFLNGQKVKYNTLKKYSCFIGENVFEKVNSSENLLTAKECIEKALYISGLDYSTAEIKDIFSLSDQRFERPLEYVSGEIWQISTAVNFALGKDIFCYPWLNEFDIFRYETACELGTIDFLKNKGKIVLVPSSQKNKLKRLCDHTMEFSKGMFSFK